MISELNDDNPVALAPEESLDPRDWNSLRRLGHRMVDDMLHHLESVRERPAWQPVPETSRHALDQPLPREPEGAEAAYADFLEHVLPYPTGNIHPRFWGWVNGTGTPLAALAEMLAATVNPNAAGFDQAATYVEEQVLAWLKEALGYPATASGILVSGGSMANLVALAVARNARAGFDVRKKGLAGGPRLTLYTSRETHYSVAKGVEMLGLGNDALRLVPVTDELTIDVDALAAAVNEDRRRGSRPIAIVANAGTVNTGAIDDLPALADLAAAEGLWLHVDGAFGALAALSPRLAPLVTGLDRADSLAFDLHKWGYLPYEAGCVLVKDADRHRATFEMTPAYLSRIHGGLVAGGTRWADYGIQLSRGFKALKVWMTLKAEGMDKLGRLIEKNVEQAHHLAERVRASEHLELLAPVPLNVACLRFVAGGLGEPGLDEAETNELNEKILVELQESGVAVPSSTVLDGRFGIRVAITNHRTRLADLDLLVAEVERIGHRLLEDIPS